MKVLALIQSSGYRQEYSFFPGFMNGAPDWCESWGRAPGPDGGASGYKKTRNRCLLSANGDENLADDVLFDRVVRGSSLLQREAVQRQSGCLSHGECSIA